MSREYGLSLGMLGRWMEQYKLHGENSFQGQPWRAQAMTSEARVAQLEEELRLTQLEVKFMRQLLAQKKSPGGSD
jgi:transposase-like protein